MARALSRIRSSACAPVGAAALFSCDLPVRLGGPTAVQGSGPSSCVTASILVSHLGLGWSAFLVKAPRQISRERLPSAAAKFMTRV